MTLAVAASYRARVLFNYIMIPYDSSAQSIPRMKSDVCFRAGENGDLHRIWLCHGIDVIQRGRSYGNIVLYNGMRQVAGHKDSRLLRTLENP